ARTTLGPSKLLNDERRIKSNWSAWTSVIVRRGDFPLGQLGVEAEAPRAVADESTAPSIVRAISNTSAELIDISVQAWEHRVGRFSSGLMRTRCPQKTTRDHEPSQLI